MQKEWNQKVPKRLLVRFDTKLPEKQRLKLSLDKSADFPGDF